MNRQTPPFPGADDPHEPGDGADEAIGALLRGHASRHAAPAGLRQAILTQMEASSEPAASPVSSASPATSVPRWRGWLAWLRTAFGERLLAGTGGFAAGVLALWLALPWLAPQPTLPARSDMLALLVDSHLRSLQVDHLTDVLSSDRHTVKPWFAGKLDYTPPVRDLASEGFPLVGGRLEVLQGRQVAVLVFRHKLHTINLFIQPDDGADSAPRRLAARRGFQLVAWQADGMRFTLVSDLNADMLMQLAAKYAAN